MAVAPSPPGPQGLAAPAMVADVGLTFDDVLLVPQASEVMPGQVSIATRVTKSIEPLTLKCVASAAASFHFSTKTSLKGSSLSV